MPPKSKSPNSNSEPDNDYEIYAAPCWERSFWQESPIPKAVVSQTGQFERVNPAWSKLLGYAQGELIGLHFEKITHPADVEDDKREVENLIRDPEATGYSMVKRYITKAGRTTWVELHVLAVREPILRFVVTVIPLPDGEAFKVEKAGDGYRVRAIVRILDVLRDNPKESLIFLILFFVAIGVIPFETVLEIIKTFLAK